MANLPMPVGEKEPATVEYIRSLLQVNETTGARIYTIDAPTIAYDVHKYQTEWTVSGGIKSAIPMPDVMVLTRGDRFSVQKKKNVIKVNAPISHLFMTNCRSGDWTA